jgi:hypothetical protein
MEAFMNGVMPLARQLGEKLGGDPWIKPIEEMPRVSAVRLPNPSLWPESVRAEMEAIRRGEIL